MSLNGGRAKKRVNYEGHGDHEERHPDDVVHGSNERTGQEGNGPAHDQECPEEIGSFHDSEPTHSRSPIAPVPTPSEVGPARWESVSSNPDPISAHFTRISDTNESCEECPRSALVRAVPRRTDRTNSGRVAMIGMRPFYHRPALRWNSWREWSRDESLRR